MAQNQTSNEESSNLWWNDLQNLENPAFLHEWCENTSAPSTRRAARASKISCRRDGRRALHQCQMPKEVGHRRR